MVIFMIDVRTAVRVDDSLTTPYLVALQINIEDSEFRQRLIHVARLKNIRLGCEKKSALASAVTLEELNVEIVRDEERIDRVGYLDEYLERGYVFGFENEVEAREFAKKAEKVMAEYLQSQYDHFRVLLKSEEVSPRKEARQHFGKLAGIAAVVLVAIVIGMMGDSGTLGMVTPAQKISSEDTPVQELDEAGRVRATVDSELTADLEAYLFENFGGAGDPSLATSWYGYIENVEVIMFYDKLEITVHTSIYPDAEGKEMASSFLPSIWGWANRADEPKNVTFVKVLGHQDRILATQKNPLY